MKSAHAIILPLLLMLTACDISSSSRLKPPEFTLQPVNVTMQEGRTATFYIKASGRPAPLICWERSDNGDAWAALPDASGDTCSFTAQSDDNGVLFRARADNGAGAAVSDAATLSIVTDSLVNQVSQYGITWTFDREYLSGQFVSGDFWVIGPVTVLAVNPRPSTADGIHRNGSMINPRNGAQSYDSGAGYFGHPYDDGSGVRYPASIETASSLVSAISVMPTREDPYPRPSLKSASVLTVLSESPEEGSFRPGLIGEYKKIYNVNDINWNLLPGLDPTPSIPSAEAIGARYTARLTRPWLLHGSGWLHRHIMPEDNSPSYHRDVAMLLDEAAVLCVTDWSDDAGDLNRRDLVTRYIQVAIDYYAMQQDGETGSHGAYNYRWPTIFAGIMLGDDEMRDMWVDETYSTPSYHENTLYYWEDQRRTVHSAIISAADTWTSYQARTGNRAVFYDILDLQQPNVGCHEELHPSEWDTLIDLDEYPGGGRKQEGYRQMHSASIPGFALAAYAFGAAGLMDFPEYFDYADRWMTETEAVLMESGAGAFSPYRPQTSYSIFVDEMWQEHRGGY